MSTSPIISVLVGVYNREQYLAQSLKSILASKFADFEVVIVDDHSTDNSLTIANEFAAHDSRCRVFSNLHNLGQFQNRNKVVEYARGTYIKYLDSDDILYPHSLAIMFESISAFPNASHGVCSPLADPSEPYPRRLTPETTYQQEFLGRGCLSAGPSATIIKTEAFRAVGGFRYLGIMSDIDLLYRLAARWDTVLMPPALIWWRQHEGQSFTEPEVELDYLKGGYGIITDALNSGECPLNSADRQQAIKRMSQHQARKLLRLAIRKRRPLCAYGIAKSCGLSLPDILRGFGKYI